MGTALRPRLLLVTGMSGAGKSTVLDALEDMGWDCVDNLPTALLDDFVRHGHPDRPAPSIAVGIGVPSRGFDAAAIPSLLASIEGVDAEILFLDCAGAELIRRYDETRRKHPLAADRPAEDGIARERALLAPVRLVAEGVLDTTDLKPADLRDELVRRFGDSLGQPVVTIASFGFSKGVSRTADLMFDMRFLDNPHWDPVLRPMSGLDAPVRERVSSDPAWSETMDGIEGLLKSLISRYWAAGKSYVTVAFGCTGGRHRSVAAAVDMAGRLRAAGFSPKVRHRDLASPPSDRIEGLPAGAAAGHDEAGE